MKRFAALLLCLCLCISLVPAAAAADLDKAQAHAGYLKELGLFKGVSDTNFDLGRSPTRVEALVMLIRVLGAEKEALNGVWTHPFSDMAAWADPYVGYAWEKGLTKGISDTQFGTGRAGCGHYLTFMLRALGYDDNDGDFRWDNPYPLAQEVNLLPAGVDREAFLRADAVLVSYAALSANINGYFDRTLADKLISAGVFTRAQYDAILAAAAAAVTPEEARRLELREKFGTYIKSRTNGDVGSSPALILHNDLGDSESWDAIAYMDEISGTLSIVFSYFFPDGASSTAFLDLLGDNADCVLRHAFKLPSGKTLTAKAVFDAESFVFDQPLPLTEFDGDQDNLVPMQEDAASSVDYILWILDLMLKDGADIFGGIDRTYLGFAPQKS